MAEAHDSCAYRHVEKKYIDDLYESRSFQRAKEEGKVICVDCHLNNKSINFFTKAGVDYHYRRVHKRSTFDSNESLRLFKNLHFAESKRFIEQLSTFRADHNHDVRAFKEFIVQSKDLETDIFAKSKKEAVKLAGLVLSHGEFVHPMTTSGYPISVIEKANSFDFPEKFIVWRASSKIYTESVYTREVNTRLYIILYFDRFLYKLMFL